jgi:bacteriorhodopsin
MIIWDAATIFVLVLTVVYFGFFAWIEIHSRRNQNKVSTHKQEVEAEPVEQIPQTAAPPAEITRRRRGTGSGSVSSRSGGG